MAKAKTNNSTYEQQLAELTQSVQTLANVVSLMQQRMDAQSTTEQPKTDKPEPEPANTDKWLCGKHATRNAEILEQVKPEYRARVRNALKRAIAAGFTDAFLARNKTHQLDGLSLYCGISGKGHDKAFTAIVTKDGKAHQIERERAKANNQPVPTVNGLFYWSPSRGGKLYGRGFFEA